MYKLHLNFTFRTEKFYILSVILLLKIKNRNIYIRKNIYEYLLYNKKRYIQYSLF